MCELKEIPFSILAAKSENSVRNSWNLSWMSIVYTRLLYLFAILLLFRWKGWDINEMFVSYVQFWHVDRCNTSTL